MPRMMEDNMGMGPEEPINMEDSERGDACPQATGDITLNLKNRGKAIDKADYGPMDPNQPNDQYWRRMGQRWKVSGDEAKTMRCGNCAAFNQKQHIIKCIEEGIGDGMEDDAMDVIEAGVLGFCEIFDFKCAAKRTCAAWIVGGPIKDESEGDDSDEYEDEDGAEEDQY
jgi:hypothetical protein